MRRNNDVESVNNFQSDPNFRHYVFGDHHGEQNGTNKHQYDQPTKLGEFHYKDFRRFEYKTVYMCTVFISALLIFVLTYQTGKKEIQVSIGLSLSEKSMMCFVSILFNFNTVNHNQAYLFFSFFCYFHVCFTFVSTDFCIFWKSV